MFFEELLVFYKTMLVFLGDFLEVGFRLEVLEVLGASSSTSEPYVSSTTLHSVRLRQGFYCDKIPMNFAINPHLLLNHIILVQSPQLFHEIFSHR